MKNIIVSAILGTLLFTQSSCSDFLSNEPVGGPSEQTFWKTEQDARNAADGLFFFGTEEEITGRGLMWYANCSDDMITGRNNTSADNLRNFLRENNRETDNWPTMYQLIKKCNDIILNVPHMYISQETKNNVLGHAHFFRGWAYLWIAPYFGDNAENGGIPIVKEGLGIHEMNVPRPKSITENYLYCIAEFNKAADLLPLYSDLSKDQKGRPHKTAAWAYAAKAALYNAQYDESYYAKVEEFCNLIIPYHELHPSYEELFTIAQNWSTEYIWSFTSNEIDGSKLPGVMLENKGWGKYNGWGYYSPTLDLYKTYEAGDLRRDVTILYPGRKFMFLGEERTYYSTEPNSSGLMFNKYMDPFKAKDAVGTTVNTNGDNGTTDFNIPLIRFAEVLLWKAEALIWQGKNGDNELNLLRSRAGLSPLKNATKAALKHERRVELAGEFGTRHFDLVRWGDAQETYAKPQHGVRVETEMKTIDGIEQVIIKNIEEVQVWKARNFDPKINHVFAIPRDEINNSAGVLIQNKGF